MSLAIHTPEKKEAARQAKYFLPYQIRWLLDRSMQKIWEKTRRGGMTYAQSYEDVDDCVKQPKLPVWFSSADESAAREYIYYCEQWVKVFGAVAQSLGSIVIDAEKGIKAFVIEFSNGSRIHALCSNPKAFRSKGGKVVLDEFAWHDDQDGMWAAAEPVTTWGYPVRVLSTHNGKQCRFFRMLDEAKKELAATGHSVWSVHTTPIQLAVAEGLADKILRRPLTDAERAEWLEKKRKSVGDDTIWQQEYCCVPVDEATAFLTYDLIRTVEEETAGDPSKYEGGPVFIGNDIARRKDLFVIWVDERMGDVKWNREIVTLKGATFAAQDAEMDRIVKTYPAFVRICMDQTGMGEKPVEDAKRRYGPHKVEGVLMTNEVKQELANTFKRSIEDRRRRVPKTAEVRDDLHAVKKITTVAGNVRFDAERTEQGHADRFWSAALANHAADEPSMPGLLQALGQLAAEQKAKEEKANPVAA